ncbi:MAG: hypothetical protein FWB79_05160 [Treponema sp.]|nr:hypothetical protein [Treponema sp.]
MENQVLGYKSPLYGRQTCQFKVKLFGYHECAEVLPGFSAEDRITLYGICGGILDYVSRINNGIPVKQNAESLFFNPSRRHFEEPSSLLKQKLRSPQTYNGIIAAIASSISRLNEIASKAGIETSQCSNMLATLVALEMVKEEHPIRLSFVKPEGKTGGKVETYMEPVFEECAVQFLWREMAKKQYGFKDTGRWRGSNPREKRQEEIDFIAKDSQEGAIFGKCKWRASRTGSDTLDDLVRKSELFPYFEKKRYMLFSKSDFSSELKKVVAQREDVVLVGLGDMF